MGATAGRRSLVASRYPALALALGDRGGGAAGEPTIHEAATAAVEHKDAGAAVEPGVAARSPRPSRRPQRWGRGHSPTAATCSCAPVRAAAISA